MRKASKATTAAAISFASLLLSAARPAQAETWHIQNLPGNFHRTLNPAADFHGTGWGAVIDLYAAHTDQSVSVNFGFLGAWAGWTHLGGQVTTSLSAVSAWPNHSEVFALGTDGRLWHHTMWDNTPQGWASLGGPALCSAPSAVSWGEGRMDVFVQGCDKHLMHIWYDAGWSDWEDLVDTRIFTQPAATSYASGKLNVFVNTHNVNNTIGQEIQDYRFNGSSWGWSHTGFTPGGGSLLPGGSVWSTFGAAGFFRSSPTSFRARAFVGTVPVSNCCTSQSSAISGTRRPNPVWRGTGIGSGKTVLVFYLDNFAENGAAGEIAFHQFENANFVAAPATYIPDTAIGSEPIPLRVNNAVYVFAVKQDNSISVQSLW